MEKTYKKDWNDERNRACSGDWGFNITYYVAILSNFTYQSLSGTEQHDILRIHQHISGCRTCGDGYVFLKEILASNSEYDVLSPDNFRLLEENERNLTALPR